MSTSEAEDEDDDAGGAECFGGKGHEFIAGDTAFSTEKVEGGAGGDEQGDDRVTEEGDDLLGECCVFQGIGQGGALFGFRELGREG